MEEPPEEAIVSGVRSDVMTAAGAGRNPGVNGGRGNSAICEGLRRDFGDIEKALSKRFFERHG